MRWTSVTGESTWTCENCGKRNTIGTGPSPGPSDRQTCSGCDHYQEVSQDRTARIIALVVLLGAVGATILIGGEVAAAFWLLVLLLAGVSRMFFPAGAPP